MPVLAIAAGLPGLLFSRGAVAQLATRNDSDASAGLKGPLEAGASAAVKMLGRRDGLWGNDRLRIALPDWMQRSEKALRLAGYGKDIDALKLGVNRAAEQAVPQAQVLLG